MSHIEKFISRENFFLLNQIAEKIYFLIFFFFQDSEKK